MKKIAFFIPLLISLIASSQKTEKFYDYNWKECDSHSACYYSLIEKKDSGWLRSDYFVNAKKLQMQGLYKDEECKIQNGTFYYFHVNGVLSQSGRYVDTKKEGLWISQYRNGMSKDSTWYKNGKPFGISMHWHPNGYTSDSVNIGEDGRAVWVSWFDNGVLSSAGYRMNDKQTGKWKYYHGNGNISAIEVYNDGVLKSREYYDESGNLLSDTTNKDRQASFPGGEKAWGKFLLSQVFFPSQYKFTDDGSATVIISMIVDEQGNLINPELEIPLQSSFDNLALRGLKKSPKWLPAIDHNRKVKFGVRQPFTFTQETTAY
ncbi:MAG: hypothetical protein QM764_08495 [Chitinophagaceae bacterium]